MSKSLLGRLLAAAAAFALASCGGGGGSGGAGLTSTPPPTPPPPPPPPPPPTYPAIFPGITTDTEFAVLGLEASKEGIPASSLTTDGFSVRYDASVQAYLVDLPSTSAASKFTSTDEDGAYWSGFLPTNGSNFSVLKPSPANPQNALAYTTYGVSSEDYPLNSFGFVAFGSATASSGIPLSGASTYDARVAGRPLSGGGFISGDATLQFNFGNGTLSGHFDPILNLSGFPSTNLGSYNFVNTVFGVGSTSYSGSLSHSGTNTLGAFDGLFTGPVAQELMARWTAPYLNPSTQQWSEMFGVWVGKKQ